MLKSQQRTRRQHSDELLGRRRGEAAIVGVAGESGIRPMPTIYRLLQTLLTHGYVRQLPSRRYALGPRLINLGVSAGNMLSEWARPWLVTGRHTR